MDVQGTNIKRQTEQNKYIKNLPFAHTAEEESKQKWRNIISQRYKYV